MRGWAVGRQHEGIGRGFAAGARVVVAPLVLALALAALPARSRGASSSTTALRERAAAVAGSPEGAAVEASLAALFSNPALGRVLRDELERATDPSTRDLLGAALDVSRASSALAGRLLHTPSTAVDRARLAQLATDLDAYPALARLARVGATLQRQAWPTQVALARTRTALSVLAHGAIRDREPAAAGDGAATLVRDVETSASFRSAAAAFARVLDDPGATAFVAALPPVVATGFLDRSALDALSGPSGADDTGVRLAVAVVIVASALLDGSPDVVATAIVTAPALTGPPPQTP